MMSATPLDGNVVEFLEWQDLPVLYVPKWWDRPRWWLVKALGGSNPRDTVKVVRVPVNGKTFMERLWKQKRSLVENFRREPMTLWIGGEDYSELMSSPQVRQEFMVHAEFRYGRGEIYGLKVRVIPWMRGMLVMPNG